MSPANGNLLKVMQNNVTPSAQISTGLPAYESISASQTSGAKKWNVPSVYVTLSDCNTLDTPKSISTGLPSLNNMF